MPKGYTKSKYTGKLLLTPSLKLIGGKSKSRDLLYTLMPRHEVYLEPFLGSSTILMGKKPSSVELVSDINPFLINFFKVLQDKPEEFWEMYEVTLRLLNNESFFFHRTELTGPTSDVCQALDFYMVTKLSNNGIVRFNKTGACNSSYCKQITGRGFYTREWFDAVRDRIKNVTFQCQDYKEALKQVRGHSGNTLVMLDSPYHAVKTIYNGDYWKEDRFLEYASAIKDLTCNWLMTINDTPFVRELFKGYNIREHELFYSCSNTGTDGRGMKKELIVANYPISEGLKSKVDGKEETQNSSKESTC